jgi:hypothetical protein
MKTAITSHRPLLTIIRSRLSFIPVAIALACFWVAPIAQAVVPAPDGGYPGGNTAEGQAALSQLQHG